nr:MAG TPA: hypothetical protein [Caudoviricetes sp.]
MRTLFYADESLHFYHKKIEEVMSHKKLPVLVRTSVLYDIF